MEHALVVTLMEMLYLFTSHLHCTLLHQTSVHAARELKEWMVFVHMKETRVQSCKCRCALCVSSGMSSSRMLKCFFRWFIGSLLTADCLVWYRSVRPCRYRLFCDNYFTKRRWCQWQLSRCYMLPKNVYTVCCAEARCMSFYLFVIACIVGRLYLCLVNDCSASLNALH